MENAANNWERSGFLALLFGAMRFEGNPAVLMLNHHLDWGKPDQWPDSHESAVARWGATNASAIEDEIAEIAREYGAGSVSVFHALRPLLLDPTWPPPKPLHRPFKDQFRVDGVHFNLFMTMPIYTGDLMIEWLRTAVFDRKALSTRGSSEKGPPKDEGEAGEAVATFEFAQDAQHTPLVALIPAETGADLQLPQQVPERYQREPGVNNMWFRTNHPIDGPEEVRARIKPGLVSVVPGAVAELILKLPPEAQQQLPRIKFLSVGQLLIFCHCCLIVMMHILACVKGSHDLC